MKLLINAPIAIANFTATETASEYTTKVLAITPNTLTLSCSADSEFESIQFKVDTVDMLELKVGAELRIAVPEGTVAGQWVTPELVSVTLPAVPVKTTGSSPAPMDKGPTSMRHDCGAKY